MTAQSGALILLKIGDGGTPTETFATIGGMRTNSFTLNNQAVEATNKDSGAWRQLLKGAGIRSVNLSGSGLFTDSVAEETLRSAAFNNSTDNYELHFGNGDSLSLARSRSPPIAGAVTMMARRPIPLPSPARGRLPLRQRDIGTYLYSSNGVATNTVL